MSCPAERIVRHYSGDWSASRRSGNIPGEGHSRHDRSVTVTDKPGAPDGVLVHCHNGSDALAEKDRFRRDGLLAPFEPKSNGSSFMNGGAWKPKPANAEPAAEHAVKLAAGQRIVATFEYRTPEALLYRKHRREPGPNGRDKDFVYDHPIGSGGWKAGQGSAAIPYRLCDLVAANRTTLLFMAEGERKADKLSSWGLLATSLKDWRAEFAEHVTGRKVIILPDNDEPGETQAKKAAELISEAGGTPILVRLPGLEPGEDIMEWKGSADDLGALATKALDELGPKVITATPYSWRDPETLPRRPWIYGRQLLRGSVFVLIAPGATGKSGLMAGAAMALCTGKPLLGHEVWGGAKRVWIWNLEDSLADLAFSIQAAALHWGISEVDLDGRLFVDSGLDGATLKLARVTRDGPQINAEVSAQIVAEIKHRRIDVLIVDPFISSHGLNDENDNAAIDMVAKEWARIATAAGCAVILVHHSKKLGGGEVNAESARGASSLVDAARGGLALNTMTQAEAEGFGIAADQRRRFFRAEDAKPNRAPPGGGQWHEMVSVYLGNGVDGGDSVGVATPWKAPDPFDEVAGHHLGLVQGKIADGIWRHNPQAADWAGKAVAEVLGFDIDLKADKRKAKAILETWIRNDVLRVQSRPDKNGDMRPFVIVGKPA